MTPSMLVVAPEREAGFMVLAKNEDVQRHLIKPSDEHRRMIVRNRRLLEHISGKNKTR